MEAVFGAALIVAYVFGVFALAAAAVYVIAREAETVDEDANRERERMDLL